MRKTKVIKEEEKKHWWIKQIEGTEQKVSFLRALFKTVLRTLLEEINPKT